MVYKSGSTNVKMRNIQVVRGTVTFLLLHMTWETSGETGTWCTQHGLLDPNISGFCPLGFIKDHQYNCCLECTNKCLPGYQIDSEIPVRSTDNVQPTEMVHLRNSHSTQLNKRTGEAQAICKCKACEKGTFSNNQVGTIKCVQATSCTLENKNVKTVSTANNDTMCGECLQGYNKINDNNKEICEKVTLGTSTTTISTPQSYTEKASTISYKQTRKENIFPNAVTLTSKEILIESAESTQKSHTSHILIAVIVASVVFGILVTVVLTAFLIVILLVRKKHRPHNNINMGDLAAEQPLEPNRTDTDRSVRPGAKELRTATASIEDENSVIEEDEKIKSNRQADNRVAQHDKAEGASLLPGSKNTPSTNGNRTGRSTSHQVQRRKEGAEKQTAVPYREGNNNITSITDVETGHNSHGGEVEDVTIPSNRHSNTPSNHQVEPEETLPKDIYTRDNSLDEHCEQTDVKTPVTPGSPELSQEDNNRQALEPYRRIPHRGETGRSVETDAIHLQERSANAAVIPLNQTYIVPHPMFSRSSLPENRTVITHIEPGHFSHGRGVENENASRNRQFESNSILVYQDEQEEEETRLKGIYSSQGQNSHDDEYSEEPRKGKSSSHKGVTASNVKDWQIDFPAPRGLTEKRLRHILLRFGDQTLEKVDMEVTGHLCNHLNNVKANRKSSHMPGREAFAVKIGIDPTKAGAIQDAEEIFDILIHDNRTVADVIYCLGHLKKGKALFDFCEGLSKQLKQ